jgi:hypothetical protein
MLRAKKRTSVAFTNTKNQLPTQERGQNVQSTVKKDETKLKLECRVVFSFSSQSGNSEPGSAAQEPSSLKTRDICYKNKIHR